MQERVGEVENKDIDKIKSKTCNLNCNAILYYCFFLINNTLQNLTINFFKEYSFKKDIKLLGIRIGPLPRTTTY